MKQLSFLADGEDTLSSNTVYTWKVYIDGASRNNPGLAGAGVYIIKNEKPIYKKSFFLGIRTNNQAEYSALLLGLCYIKQHAQSNDTVHIFSDSQLLVRQLIGVYKVKHPELKPLHHAAVELLKTVRYTVAHIMREQNTHADALANAGIDSRTPIPLECKRLLEPYNITW